MPELVCVAFMQFISYLLVDPYTGSSEKIPAKLSDTCSVRADGLCIGCLSHWAERGQENLNMQEFFARPCRVPFQVLTSVMYFQIRMPDRAEMRASADVLFGRYGIPNCPIGVDGTPIRCV